MEELAMMTKDILRLINIDPNEYQVRIAGGAIRDSIIGRIPKDVDLFIYAENAQKAMHLESKLEQAVLTEDGLRGYLSHGISTYSNGECKHIQPSIEGVVNELPFQVMVTNHKSNNDLIKSFDWNICCATWSPTEGLYDPFEVEYRIKNDEMSLIHMTNPFANLRRGYRFSERYGLKLRTDDIHTLTKEINKRIEQKPFQTAEDRMEDDSQAYKNFKLEEQDEQELEPNYIS